MFEYAGRLFAKLRDWLQSTELGERYIEIVDLTKFITLHGSNPNISTSTTVT